MFSEYTFFMCFIESYDDEL